MKKNLFISLAGLMLFAGLFVSCQKDDDNSSTPVTPVTPEDGSPYAEYPYSELSPEEQKEKLSEETSALLSGLSGAKECQAVAVYNTFNALLSISTPEPYVGLDEKEVILLADAYTTFTWNPETETWVSSENTEGINFLFPVGEQQGSVTVIAESSEENIPIGPEQQVEAPKKVTAILALDGEQLGKIEIESDIYKHLNGVPGIFSSSFSFCDYSLSASFAKASPNTITVSLKNGETVFFDAKLSVDAVLDSIVAGVDGYDFGDYNMLISVGTNLAFVGEFKTQQYDAAIDAAWKKYNDADNAAYAKYEEAGFTEEALQIYIEEGHLIRKTYAEDKATAWNNYVTLFLISTTDKTKIATVTQRAEQETESFTYKVWNGEESVLETYTYSYWTTVPVLVFDDSTEVDATVYFSEGFEKVLEELLELLAEWGVFIEIY